MSEYYRSNQISGFSVSDSHFIEHYKFTVTYELSKRNDTILHFAEEENEIEFVLRYKGLFY